MIYRARILKHWLSGKRNNVTFTELVKYLSEPSFRRQASSVIKEIEDIESFRVVYFEGIENPLYYPREFRIDMLYLIVSQEFYRSNWHYYEIEQTRVTSGDVVLDCGAAEGLFSLLVAHKCKKVFAIEPLPRFIDSMRLTFREFQNVEVIPCALSDAPCNGYLSRSDVSSSLVEPAEDSIPVSIETVDELFYEKGIRVDHIKADIEGYEMKMLAGALETIKEYKPKITITTYHKPEHAREISSFLAEIDDNYEIILRGIEARVGAPVMLHAWIRE